MKGCSRIRARNHQRWSICDWDYFQGSGNGVKGCIVLTFTNL
jgi:hypothetical protein